VKSALQTLFNDAGSDLQRFRKGVEGWFNSAMDRVSGWYKRRTHVIIFALGFVIAVRATSIPSRSPGSVGQQGHP